ncbi:MAG: IclR family transcriptional regulator [Actinobacteria bacterium]|nr:IclR family transcriptional regulator [Actinomycetota bacterium]
MPRTIRKATKVLDLFSLERPEWGVNEVARALGFPKSTTSELMSSLAEQRLLSRTVKGRYRLGWRLFELSQTLLDTTEFRVEARRVMEELVRRWRETVHLAVLDGVQAVYIEKLQPNPAVKIKISRTGARLPAHCSGVGKVLLAHCEWEYVAELLKDQRLPALTGNTVTNFDVLAEELERVREQGYAYDEEETSVGLCCVAAPIYDSGGKVVASISLSVPAYRLHPKKDEYTAAILDAADRISENAGARLKEYPDYEMEVQNT